MPEIPFSTGAGVDSKITPHMLRALRALLEKGVDICYVQTMLGHTTITTPQIYTEVRDGHQRRMLTARHPRRKMRAGS